MTDHIPEGIGVSFERVDFHQAVSDSDPVGFRLVRPFVEIAPLPVDGPLEDQRFAGVGGLDFLPPICLQKKDLFCFGSKKAHKTIRPN